MVNFFNDIHFKSLLIFRVSLFLAFWNHSWTSTFFFLTFETSWKEKNTLKTSTALDKRQVKIITWFLPPVDAKNWNRCGVRSVRENKIERRNFWNQDMLYTLRADPFLFRWYILPPTFRYLREALLARWLCRKSVKFQNFKVVPVNIWRYNLTKVPCEQSFFDLPWKIRKRRANGTLPAR